MDMLEKLLPLLFLLFWAVIAVQSRKKKVRKPPPLPPGARARDRQRAAPAAGSGETKKRQPSPPLPARSFLDGLRVGFEGLAREIRSSVGQDLPPSLGGTMQRVYEAEEGEGEQIILKPQAAEEVALSEIMSPIAQSTLDQYHSSPHPYALAGATKEAHYTVHQLRTAIVWSEILGPPLSLRED
jgi:hypothetical protein